MGLAVGHGSERLEVDDLRQLGRRPDEGGDVVAEGALPAPPSIFASSAESALVAVENSTLPLAMWVLTSSKPMASNVARSLSMVTRRPPTLMARRNATYRVMPREPATLAR